MLKPQKNGTSLYIHLELSGLNSGAQLKGLSSSKAKPPANRAIFFNAKKTSPRHDPRKCAKKLYQQYAPHPRINEKKIYTKNNNETGNRGQNV